MKTLNLEPGTLIATQTLSCSSHLPQRSSSAVPATLSSSSSPSPPPSAQKSLLSLPSEIVDLIAFFVAADLGGASGRDCHCEENERGRAPPRPTPPAVLLHLLLTCRQLYTLLKSSNNPRLYARIFRAKFDTAAIARRFGSAAVSPHALSLELQKRCTILKRIRRACELSELRPEGNNEVGAAHLRENLWLVYMMLLENDGRNMEPLAWADIKGYLHLHHVQEMLESALEPGYPPDSEDRALALHIYTLVSDVSDFVYASQDEAEERLFVLRPFVFASHKFESFFAPWTLKSLPIRRLEETVEVMNKVERAKAAGMVAAGTSSPAPARERGIQSHDGPALLTSATAAAAAAAPGLSSAHHSPLRASQMPEPQRDVPENPSLALPLQSLQRLHGSAAAPASAPAPAVTSGTASPFVEDLSPKVRQTTLTHCGQQIEIRPPILALAAYSIFFLQVEKNPAIVGLAAIVERGAEHGTMTRLGALGLQRTPMQLGLLHPQLSSGRNGEDVTSQSHILSSRLHLRSIDHDRDLARLVACRNPYSSPGLRPCFFEGVFAGAWEGRFSFFDFDSYREMLAGRMRYLYEGPFGEQPQVWKLREHFVRVGDGYRKEMGEGSIITAGFHLEDPSEDLLMLPRSVREAREQAREVGNGKRAPAEDDKDNKSKRSNSLEEGASATRSPRGMRITPPPADYALYPRFSEEEGGASAGHGYLSDGFEVSDTSDERYEMLISGIGHSAWGRFIVRGRVRAWDGMVVLSKEYRPDGRGRWIYRGYATAGDTLIGRWRDSFTPGELSGYEGPFVLSKRDARLVGLESGDSRPGATLPRAA